jgi:hypothetical protein
VGCSGVVAVWARDTLGLTQRGYSEFLFPSFLSLIPPSSPFSFQPSAASADDTSTRSQPDEEKYKSSSPHCYTRDSSLVFVRLLDGVLGLIDGLRGFGALFVFSLVFDLDLSSLYYNVLRYIYYYYSFTPPFPAPKIVLTHSKQLPSPGVQHSHNTSKQFSLQRTLVLVLHPLKPGCKILLFMT